MQNKPKLSFQQQIEHLKQKGVTFKIYDEKTAISILEKNNYFFRLNQYVKNFQGDVDFAFLVDISTIDMHFRRLVLHLTLDIEHFLKVKIMRNFTNSTSDGYEIVRDFLDSNANIKNKLCQKIDKIKRNDSNLSPSDSILKNCGINLAIWDFIEIIPFGEFIFFSKFFYEKYSDKDFAERIKYGLFNISALRNAAAHNNSLLADMSDNCQKPSHETIIFLTRLLNSSYNSMKNSMKNNTINDFVTSFIIFSKFASKGVKDNFYKEILNFLNNRALKHKEFYANSLLKEKYKFVKEIVEKMKQK